MIKVILLAILFVVCVVAEDAKSEPSLSASRNQEYFGSGADRGAFYKDNDLEFTDAENSIIQDVFSPDYYEPNIILDYRYLKSGGRGYARSEGGQVLILPRRDHMPPPQNNYDTLLEYLRLKHLEQISKPFNPNSRLKENYGEFDEGRENVRENMGLNIKENIGEDMRGNMGGNVRGNMGGNIRKNVMRENMRENMGGNKMRGNMRENMGENGMRGNMRENMRDNLREDRRDSGYRKEKLDQHDIENKFQSDAELGSALYNH